LHRLGENLAVSVDDTEEVAQVVRNHTRQMTGGVRASRVARRISVRASEPHKSLVVPEVEGATRKIDGHLRSVRQTKMKWLRGEETSRTHVLDERRNPDVLLGRHEIDESTPQDFASWNGEELLCAEVHSQKHALEVLHQDAVAASHQTDRRVQHARDPCDGVRQRLGESFAKTLSFGDCRFEGRRILFTQGQSPPT